MVYGFVDDCNQIQINGLFFLLLLLLCLAQTKVQLSTQLHY